MGTNADGMRASRCHESLTLLDLVSAVIESAEDPREVTPVVAHLLATRARRARPEPSFPG